MSKGGRKGRLLPGNVPNHPCVRLHRSTHLLRITEVCGVLTGGFYGVRIVLSVKLS